MAKTKLSGKERFDQIIDRYKAAYERANGKSALFLGTIEYKNGFVYVGSGKHRISQFEKMCETLESREPAKDVIPSNQERENNAVLAIKAIHQLPQAQYDLEQQLRELRIAANKLGLYDAADFLREHI